MKKICKVLSVIIASSFLLYGCQSPLSREKVRDRDQPSDEKMYNLALELLEKGKYADAYTAFFELGDYEDSAEYLKKFTVLPKKTNVTESHEYTETTEYRYDSNGWLQNITEIDKNGVINTERYSSGKLRTEDVEFDRFKDFFEEDSEYIRIYDEKDRLVRLEMFYEDTEGAYEGETQSAKYVFDYDTHDNIIKVSYLTSWSGDHYFTFEYDSDNRLIGGSEPEGILNHMAMAIYRSSYTYYPNGKLKERLLTGNKSLGYGPGTIKIEYFYNDQDQLIETKKTSFSTHTETILYEYDSHGNITTLHETGSSGTAYKYTYEGDRIDTVTVGNFCTANYEYNEYGYVSTMNLSYSSDYGNQTIYYTYKYNSDMSAITEMFEDHDVDSSDVKYSYDRNGNITTIEKEGKTFKVRYTYNTKLQIRSADIMNDLYGSDSDSSAYINLEYTYNDAGFLINKAVHLNSGATISFDFEDHEVFYDIQNNPKTTGDLLETISLT